MKTHIVFDLDGTLANTQIIHQKIESDFLKKFWVDIKPEEIWFKYAWRTPQEWIKELLKEKNISFTQEDVDTFVDYKDKTVISLLKKWKIQLMDWTLDLLEKLHNDDYKIWISSWACREFIDEFIKYFNLWDIVKASTSANEVKNKKPFPDVFEKSFEQLEKQFQKADKKWVVGDGWSDVVWWHKAWAKTIWINTNIPKNKEYLDYQVWNIKEVYDIIVG